MELNEEVCDEYISPDNYLFDILYTFNVKSKNDIEKNKLNKKNSDKKIINNSYNDIINLN